jgi:hypothetical protein
MINLLLLYNKVTNNAFHKLNSINVKFADVSIFDKKMDILSYSNVDIFLTNLLPFDNILIGDIFWPTGQNICKWCANNNKKCIFLQHGQWIYIKNKTNPEFLPSITCVYGRNVANMIKLFASYENALLEIQAGSRGRTQTNHFVYLLRNKISHIEEWLNRPLVKANLDTLRENKLFFYIRDKQKQK